MSSRRAEDVPLDPADVEDIRLRIEAHQRATEMEAASAKAFRSECERAHGEFLRAISRLDEERQVRHAEQLDELDVTYARARLAGPAVSAELLALRRLARDIARGLAAREAGRGGTRREDDGVVVRPEKDALKKKNVSDSAAKNASDRFALAFAAGFETVAYSAARWTARRERALFAGADPMATSLFVWHLAEEVEHKGVAHDVHAASGGGRLRYVVAMTLSMLLLAGFTVAGTLSMLWSTRRIFHPMAHVRMLVWSISFLFELLPNMAVSAVPGRHPDDFVDPHFFSIDLLELDSSAH